MTPLLTTNDVAEILGVPEFTITKRRTAWSMPHFVYLVRGPANEVIYVGQTKNPASRITSHKRSSEWWEWMRRVEFYRIGSRRDALDTELRLIRAFKPRYNIWANPPW